MVQNIHNLSILAVRTCLLLAYRIVMVYIVDLREYLNILRLLSSFDLRHCRLAIKLHYCINIKQKFHKHHAKLKYFPITTASFCSLWIGLIWCGDNHFVTGVDLDHGGPFSMWAMCTLCLVGPHYSTVDFITNISNQHPTGGLWRWSLGCLL